jgi:hypothetical protein
VAQLIVYLDINHWYAVGLAAEGKPQRPEHTGILTKLQTEVDAGHLRFPLSSITYEELTENPRDQLREPAARVMFQLSKPATIAPASKVVDEELVVELNRRFGRPAFPAKVEKFGFGVGLAFGTPGQLKAEVPADQQAAIGAKLGMTFEDAEAKANAPFEYYVLSTPRSLCNRIPNYDPNESRLQADAEPASLQALRSLSFPAV